MSLDKALAYQRAESQAGSALGQRLRQPSVREQVDAQIDAAEAHLAALKDLRAKLDEAPGVEAILDAMRKVSIF